MSPTGPTATKLWPLTRWLPPTPGLSLSTRPWPTVAAGLLAIGAWALLRRPSAEPRT